MKLRTVVTMSVICAVLLVPNGSLWAHHSLLAEFNTHQPMTERGTLTKLEWKNPHGWIHVDVTLPDGRVESWAFETGSPPRMVKQGLKRADLQIGSEVILSGFAARDGSRSAAGTTITFPDREGSFANPEATFALGR